MKSHNPDPYAHHLASALSMPVAWLVVGTVQAWDRLLCWAERRVDVGGKWARETGGEDE